MIKYTQRQRVLGLKVPMDLAKLIDSYVPIHHLKKWTRSLMRSSLRSIRYGTDYEEPLDFQEDPLYLICKQIAWSGDYDFPSIRKCIHHCNEFMRFRNKKPRIHYRMIGSH